MKKTFKRLAVITALAITAAAATPPRIYDLTPISAVTAYADDETSSATPTPTPSSSGSSSSSSSSATPNPELVDYTDENGISYTIDSDNNTAAVYYYSGSADVVSVPESITVDEVTYTVTSVTSPGFSGTSITSVTLPESFTSIGSRAFQNCQSLTSITIPAGVTEIGNQAFQSCTSLETVILTEGVAYIGSRAFNNCTNLTNVTIPESVTYIGDSAFQLCTSLTGVTIPESVTYIGDGAFNACSSLKSVTIPESVTYLGDDAFDNCTSLEIVTVPAGIDYIGSGVFYECTNLSSVTLTDGITTISNQMFCRCTSLTEITIPESVTEIGAYAFGYCTGLTEITVPASVTQIDGNPFVGCTDLTVTIAADNTSYKIDGDALLNSSGTTLLAYFGTDSEYTVPDGVTYIGNGAFYDCENLTKLTLPESVTYIGDNAFSGCTSLTSINLPEGVTYIGSYAFESCWNLESIAIPEGVTEINEYTFFGCESLTEITIPSTVTYIGFQAISCCTSLTELILPDSVDGIDYYAFYYDTALESVTMPETISYIASGAFSECTSLKSIVIPNGVESLGGIFSGCTSLESITVPESVTDIYASMFDGCSNLTVTIDENNPYYTSIDGVVFNKDCTELVMYAKGDTQYSIPDGVTSIRTEAFSLCANLESITIPASVTEIGWAAFANCTSLTTVSYSGSDFYSISIDGDNDYLTSAYEASNTAEIEYSIDNGVLTISGTGKMPTYSSCEDTPWYEYKDEITSVIIEDGITTISSYAFNTFDQITSVSLPEGITSIGGWAFCGCTNLQGITLPESLVSIGDCAFEGCENITELYIPANLTSITHFAFGGCNSIASITVSEDNTSYYVENNALYYNNRTELVWYAPASEATSLEILDTVTNIWDSAVRWCTNLESVTIPEGVENISGYAFDGCSNLTTITIPASVTFIGDSAFSDCWSLTTVNYSGSEDDWNNINIEGNNDCLTNAYDYTNNVAEVVYTLEDGVLTISLADGYESGYMPNYVGNTAPWYEDKDSITSVIISDGITRIGNYAFQFCNNITSITIPTSVTSVKEYAFDGCENLSTVYYSGTEADWENISIDGGNDYLVNAYNNSLTAEDFDWSISEYGVLTVSGTGRMPNYEECSSPWYDQRDSITSIVVAEGLTSTGSYAFCDLYNATSVSLPSTLRNIYDGTFEGCSGLTEIDIPESVVNIGSWTFNGCSSLTSMTIPAAVTNIGSAAFSGCTSLTEFVVSEGNTAYCTDDGVLFSKDMGTLHTYPAGKAAQDYEVPDTVGYILHNAFCASNVQRVTLPEGLWGIEFGAFSESSITYIYIPSTLREAGTDGGSNSLTNILSNCHSLESITVAEDNELFSSEDGVAFNKDKTQLVLYPAAKSDVTEYTVPDSVTSIGSNAFLFNSYLQTVTIPDTVTEIGSGAFVNCSALTDVNLPSGLTEINGLFGSCTSLTSFEVPDTVTTIGSDSFNGCTALETITIPESVTYIGSNAFLDCSSLKNVVIPDSVTEIGDSCFYSCTALETAYISSNVTEIWWNTFNNCTSLTTVTIPAGVTYIYDSAFSNCQSLTTVNYGGTEADWDNINIEGNNDYLINAYENSTVAEIDWSIDENGVLTISGSGKMPNYEDADENRAPWYDQRESITAIVINDGITKIGDEAFNDLSNVESVSIPDSVTKIGNCAFRHCYSLKSITLPENLTTIGYYAFEECSSLTEITIPANVYDLGNSLFVGCGSLATITVDANNTSYCTENNILYNIDKTCILCCPAANSEISDFTIPSTVTEIWDNAFYGCQTLTSVIIPDGVTNINTNAFRDCGYLRDITLPLSVTYIAWGGFASANIVNVYYEGTEDDWNNITIEDDNSTFINAYKYTTGYAANGATDLSYTIVDGVLTISGNGWMPNYGASWGWMDENDTTYRPEWYASRDEITSIVIEDGITRIGNFAFQYLTNVTSVTIADSVTEIGYQAFQFCSSLESITLSSSLNYVEAYAFDGCENLSTASYDGSEDDWSNINIEDGNDYLISAYETAKIDWNIDNGVLTISGTGKMPDYDSITNFPWGEYREEITTVIINEGITSVGNHAFDSMSNLTSVTLPEGITSIGSWSFANCTALTEINFLPDSLETIGRSAFESCASISSISIPANVSYIDFYAFGACNSVAALTVDESNEYYYSENNALYSNNKTELVYYAPASDSTSLEILDGVTSIWGSAVRFASKLTSVTIPTSVVSIGDCAFDGCDNLSIVIYDGSEDDWNSIDLNTEGNDPLITAYNNTPVIAAAMADTQIGTINAPTTMTKISDNTTVNYTDVVGEGDTVTTLYIKIDKVTPTAAPIVTLADNTIAQASSVDYNSLGTSCYYIYQFVNMDLTGATVTYGGVSTPVETSDATE